jgi:plasmid segregation protein ParM
MPEHMIIRSIDTGYGDVKWVKSSKDGRIECDKFPSLAFSTQGSKPIDSMGTRRKTVVVQVGQSRYEVGPDVQYAADRFVARNYHDAYVDTDEYAALTAGAIALMRVPHIDVLALGLPVETYLAKRRHLESLMTRVHDVGRKEGVEVRRVLVFAQPHGAMFSVAAGDKSLFEAMTLVIDVGSRTFDYLAVQAMKVFDAMSGSVNRGVSDIVRAIAEEVSADLGQPVRNLQPIEDALRRRSSLEVLGRTYPFSRFQPIVTKVAKQAVQQMLGSFSGPEQFRNVILVGGGATLYKAAVETYFNAHKIVVAKDPVFANCRGFQMLAERALKGSSAWAAAQPSTEAVATEK